MITTIEGQLEVDHERGVIWFNSKFGQCILRICSLPKPIPDLQLKDDFVNNTLDITHMIGCNWPIRISQFDHVFAIGFKEKIEMNCRYNDPQISYGMLHGPVKSLKEMLDVFGHGGCEILEMWYDVKGDLHYEPLYQWNTETNKWDLIEEKKENS